MIPSFTGLRKRTQKKAGRNAPERNKKGGDAMKNRGLIILRAEHGLGQVAMAERCGVGLSTYNLIENGKRRGSKEFWQKLQQEFDLDGERVWRLQNPEI